MIRPLELKESKPIKLPSGEFSTTDDAWSMLMAARDGDLDRVKELAAVCPGLVRYEYNYTPPMHFAVREGHLEIVQFLIEQNAFDPAYRSYPFLDSLLTIAQ